MAFEMHLMPRVAFSMRGQPRVKILAATVFACALSPMFPALGETLPMPMRPLYVDAGNHGAVIPFNFEGQLGVSGLDVDSSATMLIIRGIKAGSPAAKADLPSPVNYRVRIAAVAGTPVEEMPGPRAFCFGRKRPKSLATR
jgi:hypothetical protein